MEVGENNHPLHIGMIIITPEEEVLATIETIPMAEIDQPGTDPIPKDKTVITTEIDPTLRAETEVQATNSTPVEGVAADPGTRDPTLVDEIITGTDHLSRADLLLKIAGLLLQQHSNTSSKVGIRVTSTANS